MGQLAEDLHSSLVQGNDGADSNGLRELVSSTLARAARIAPCLTADTLGQGEAAAAKAILLDVIQRRLDLRRSRVVPGVVTSKGIGGRTLSVDGKGIAVALFQPDEIAELQALCASTGSVTAGGGAPQGTFPPAPRWPC